MKPAPFAALLALVLPVAGVIGCPVYADLYPPDQATGAVAAAGSGATSSGSSGTSGAGGCTPQSTAPCYGGPPGTEGVGICKAGVKTCAPDGMSYGPCAGEVTPTAENCATPTDEDCDGLAPPCKGTPLWGKRFGSGNSQFAVDDAVDPAGNIVVVGNVKGTVDFGGGPLAGVNDPTGAAADTFVLKLDPSGGYLWAKRFGGMYMGDHNAEQVTIDADGNVILVGRFDGMIDFGGGVLTASGYDIYVAKLDPSGGYLWAKHLGGLGHPGVAVDAAGNVLVTGSFAGTIDFGGGPLTSAGGVDAFVLKLDPSGGYLWAKRFGGMGDEYGERIAATASGGLVVSGSFLGTVDFGGGPLNSTGGIGSDDIYVASLDANGGYVWAKRFGETGKLGIGRVTVDASGAVLLAGDLALAGTVDFGGGPLTGAGSRDIYAAKLTASGDYVWAKRFGDSQDQNLVSMTVDPMGNVLLVGEFLGMVDFGGGPLGAVGSYNAFAAKLDSMGGYVWARRAGDSSGAAGVATNAIGDVVVAGSFSGMLDFGGVPLSSSGPSDIFVVEFEP